MKMDHTKCRSILSSSTTSARFPSAPIRTNSKFLSRNTSLGEAQRTGAARLFTASIVPGQWDVSAGLAERYSEVEFA
jgi:hypothetical protein